MKNYLIVAAISILAASIYRDVPFVKEETAKQRPVLYRDAWSTEGANFRNPKVFLLSGTTSTVEHVKQRYVVMVPGSEGYPSRLETRSRNVPIQHVDAINLNCAEVEFFSLSNKSIERKAAMESIEKHKAFLYIENVKHADLSELTDFEKKLTIVSKRQETDASNCDGRK